MATTVVSGENRKRKIAVLGGGVGAITAAYAITQLPDWTERYEITVYQRGWRLGGKGASGRNLAKNGRIEEHGLHIWAGFYDNSFRLMRDCYEQLVRLGLRSADAPLGTLEKAFKPLNRFFISEDVRAPDGSPDGDIEWQPWQIDFPANDAVPGDGGVVPSPFAYFQMLIEFLRGLLSQVEAAENDGRLHAYPSPPLRPGVHASLARSGVSLAGTPEHGGRLLHLAERLAGRMHENANQHAGHQHASLQALLDDFGDWLREARHEDFERNPTLRRLYIIIELGSATLRGLVADRVLTNGFDPIDRWECSLWMERHGASRRAVQSAIFRGCYDYVFGYPGGNFDHRGVGAGTAIRGLLRLAWTYKGALFYKMQAGMGDTIFAPYYQVLRARGVRFRYFEAATDLRLSPDRQTVDRIEMVRQAVAKGGDYDPLVEVRNLPCWPSEPLWDRLEDGEALKASGVNFEDESKPPTGQPFSLVRGQDFDDIVLGISLGSLPSLTRELEAASPQWADMLSGIETVATQAMQLWLTPPSAEYGWKELVERYNTGSAAEGPLQTVMTSFAEPLDTWADMSDLLGRADWGTEDRPWSIAYFCSPRSQQHVGEPLSRFRERCRDWMNEHLVRIWPRMKADGHFAWSTLHDPTGATGEARLDWQYVRTNDYGSERYVLSVPNSVGRRLRSDQSGFANLVLAGDWTLNGINAGCVEAATNSGLEAARGLTGADIEIVGAADTLPSAGPQPPGLRSRAAGAAPWPLSMAYSMGRIDGWLSFLSLPVEQVQRLLPDGLELVQQQISPPGTHPVTVLLNQQLSVRASFLPALPVLSSPYLEAIVAIGGVRHRDTAGEPEGEFAFLPILYLDSLADTIAGRLFYGLNKHVARMRMTNSRYQVESQAGQPLLQATFSERGQVGPPDRFRTFEAVRPLLTQPMIAPRAFGRWQYSLLSFDFSEASILPAFGEIDIDAAFCPNLPASRYRRPALGEGALGSFRLWTTWTLSNPLDSRRVARLSDRRGLYAANHPSETMLPGRRRERALLMRQQH